MNNSSICKKSSSRCQFQKIALEENNKEKYFQHISVKYNCYIDWGVDRCLTAYYLEEENGNERTEINDHFRYALDGKMFTPRANIIHNHLAIAKYLGVRNNFGFPESSLKYLYERRFVKERDAYCVLYKMKAPFQGHFKDCGMGRNKVENTISYLSEVISLSQAKINACDYLSECVDNNTHYEWFKLSKVNGEVFYDIMMLRLDVNHSLESKEDFPVVENHDYQIIRIDPYTGAVAGHDVLKKRPDFDSW